MGLVEDSSGVARLPAECRSGPDRVRPDDLAAEHAAGATPGGPA